MTGLLYLNYYNVLMLNLEYPGTTTGFINSICILFSFFIVLITKSITGDDIYRFRNMSLVEIGITFVSACAFIFWGQVKNDKFNDVRIAV